MFKLHNILLSIIKFPTKWLVNSKSIPNDIEGELGIDKSRPIIYLLRTHSATDLITLELSTKELGLPNPFKNIEIAGQSHPATLFVEKPQSIFSHKRKLTDIAQSSKRMFELHRQNPELDIQVVPVSVFWGRAPDRAKPSWTELLADRASPSWLRKFFIVLFLGRDVVVNFSHSVSTRYMTQAMESETRLAHKLIRLARTHFHRKSQSMTGPSLQNRYQLYNGVLGSDAVKNAISEEAATKNIPYLEAKAEAQKYIQEIAADYRSNVIRLADRILTKVWNKIYNGIDVHHADKVRELARNGHEIVYVPCHRSHMDYLLLTYVIYHEGLATPYIAAGINLNFWPAGPIFRRAGAFFIRRTFAGNKLYTAVFREYLEQLFNRGYPVKYYAEGGRSRTGRLLPAKTGMLAMTVQALLKGVERPISIVPVYIGYEHIMEVNSYLKELKGRDKQKESFFGIFSAIRKLKNYGYGFLNFGEPFLLSQYLDSHVPDWRKDQSPIQDKKPSWLTPAVNGMGTNILERINQAAAVNGMSLAALCLLSAEKRAMGKEELKHAMQCFLHMLEKAPYSQQATQPTIDAEKLLENTLSLNKFTITSDGFGTLISVDRRVAIALTYYRNNILHLFAIPGLIAAIVIGKGGSEKKGIIELVGKLYPLMKKELFMYMSNEEAISYCEKLIGAMCEIGLLKKQGRKIVAPDLNDQCFYNLWLLNRVVQETLQRYALVLSQLDEADSISRANLEKRSRMLAERMSTLHGISAPEFYDKNVLATFISALKENSLFTETDDGQLMPGESSKLLEQEVLSLISPEFAQRLQMVGAHAHQ